MVNQPVASNIVGEVSLANFTDVPLAANATWAGEFEDVKDVAFMSITVSSDKESAPAGLKFQWSINKTDVDLEDGTKIGASIGLPGRAFAITPRARYFRIVYVNGPETQMTFHVAVVHHSSGTGLISRPLGRVLTDENFAQVVRAALSAKKANGEYVNLSASDDAQLVIRAILYGVTDAGAIVPLKITDNGRLVVKTTTGN